MLRCPDAPAPIAAAAHWAKALEPQLRRVGVSRDDAEGEILVACVARWHLYDPARSSPRTFADRVARAGALNLLDAARASKRGAAIRHERLDPTGPEAIDVPATPARRGDLALDVERVVAALPPEDQRICAVLAELPVAAAAEELGVSRGYLRRRVAHLALTFEGAGLRAYLEAA